MSVINQMLKDLDQRKDEQDTSQQNFHNRAIHSGNKSKFLLIFSIVLVLLVCILGWKLFQQKQQILKTSNHEKTELKKQSTPTVQSSINSKTVQTTEVQKPVETKQNIKQVSQENKAFSAEELSNKVVEKLAKALQQANQLPITQQPKPKTVQTKDSQPSAMQQQEKPANTIVEQSQPKPVEHHVAVVKSSKKSVTKPSLNISRKQTSPDQLAKQKMASAQLALEKNNGTLAEQLLEDVLLLEPKHKEARKQLAALWFGRQANQAALNTLSQGIDLLPQYVDFRVIKAKIYLEQGRSKQAYSTLNEFVENVGFSKASIEMVSLHAGLAQQLKHFVQANNSYHYLTEQQPRQAKWWLGLAIANDSLAHYSVAKKSYKTALAQLNLTDKAKQFIEQRLAQLGDY